MATLIFALNALKVVVGLGFVIFIHELGHFLVAKWSGVYVRSFSIGFPPTIWRKKVGETEYRLGLLFLGGYVSMLGEGPESEEDPEAATNPRSLKNQTVVEKVAILSAGVVMNLALGLTFFTIAHLVGLDVVPARIGGVQAGSPAYEAGLRAGDQIVGIDGREEIDYLKLRMKVSLASAGRILRFDVKRPGVPEPIAIDIQPKRQSGADAPNIGVLQSLGLELAIDKPFEAPAGVSGKAPTSGEFKGLDTIVAVGTSTSDMIPIENGDQLERLLFDLRDKALTFQVRRDSMVVPKGGEALVETPPSHFVKFGFRTAFGPITALQGGSIAGKAGFRVGDRILKVDGRDDMDPFDLPLYAFQKANGPVKFDVARKVDGTDAEVEVVATPDDTRPWMEPNLETEAFEIPGLGLAFVVEPKVLAVVPGSEAERKGIKPGQVIRTLEVVDPKPEPGAKSEPIDLTKSAVWPYLYGMLQTRSPISIKFGIEGLKDPITLKPAIDPTSFHPFRGLNRIPMRTHIGPQPFKVALRRGASDCVDNVIGIYAMIRSLFQRRVSPTSLAGLPRIATMAYDSANAGVVPLLQFLAMLSINLAVLNFMPIPPLDGGQIAIILGEKIRGRPVPPVVLNALLIAGFVLVVSLMLFTNLNDIWILIKGK